MVLTLSPASAPPLAPALDATPVPLPEWRVEVARNGVELEPHVAAWEQLARSAVEPNVCYEPWSFRPGVEAFGGGRKLAVAFVYHRGSRPKQLTQLCGFFPFERCKVRGLPIHHLRLWKHSYSFLCTPLVQRGLERETLNTLFDWVRDETQAAWLDWSTVHGEGPFHQALVDVLYQRRMLSFVKDVYTRALLKRGADAATYCAAAINHLSHKEWKRQRRRLGEQGRLETRILHPGDYVEPWIEHFLMLEASGWKGREHTALAMKETDRAYFRSVARCAHAAGQLQMLGLYFNDAPVALKCNFLAQNGGFAFKIAFDEAFAKSSPGVQLELDNIEELHRRPGLDWMDSCAVPGHFMINRLWKDRRTIQSLLIATSRWTGNAVVAGLPFLRGLKRMIRP